MKKLKNTVIFIIISAAIAGVIYLSYTYFGSGNWPKRFESDLDRFFGEGNWECVSQETKESNMYEVYHHSSDAMYSESVPGKYKDWYISVSNEQNEKELWRITNHVFKINHDKYDIFSGKRLSNKQAFVLELFDIACIDAGEEVADNIMGKVLSEEEMECFRVTISYEDGNPQPEFYSKLWKEEWFTAEKISAEKFLSCELYDFFVDINLYDYKFEKLSEEQQNNIFENFDVIKEMLLEEYGDNASFNIYFDAEHKCEYRDGEESNT